MAGTSSNGAELLWPRSDGMVLEEFGWFGGILEEFVRGNTVPDKKKKGIKSGLRTRERGLYVSCTR